MPLLSSDLQRHIHIVLSVRQFQRFMSVIKKLGDRVEKEHDQFLRDSQRIEDRSGLASNGTNGAVTSQGIDFESLVGRANVVPPTNGPTISIDTPGDENGWDDDGWGSMLNDTVRNSLFSVPLVLTLDQVSSSISSASTTSSPTPTRYAFQPKPSKLTTNITAGSLSSISLIQSPPTNSSLAVRTITDSSRPAVRPFNSFPPPPTAPRITGPPTNSPLQPKVAQQTYPAPNYNISLTPVPPFSQTPLTLPSTPLAQQQPTLLPIMGGVLTPSKPAQLTAKSGGTLSKDDWASFDPLA